MQFSISRFRVPVRAYRTLAIAPSYFRAIIIIVVVITLLLCCRFEVLARSRRDKAPNQHSSSD
jgi:hypothetical protein